MPNQKLSDAFAELETEVKGLEQRKTSLTQDISTLESRKVFLARAIKEAETTRTEAENKANSAINELQTELTDTRSTLALERAKVADVIHKQQILSSTLVTMQATNDEEAKKLNTILEEKRQLIRETVAEQDRTRTELTELDDQVKAIKIELSTVNDELESTRVSNLEIISDLTDQVKVVQTERDTIITDKTEKSNELTVITKNLEAATLEQTECQKKHTDYVAYESRAQKALEAKEQALITREEALEDAEMRAKRRGILDNI